MCKIFGPYDYEDWITMRQLKESIDFMKRTDYTKYKIAIDKEASLLEYFIAKGSG